MPLSPVGWLHALCHSAGHREKSERWMVSCDLLRTEEE